MYILESKKLLKTQKLSFHSGDNTLQTKVGTNFWGCSEYKAKQYILWRQHKGDRGVEKQRKWASRSHFVLIGCNNNRAWGHPVQIILCTYDRTVACTLYQIHILQLQLVLLGCKQKSRHNIASKKDNTVINMKHTLRALNAKSDYNTRPRYKCTKKDEHVL